MIYFPPVKKKSIVVRGLMVVTSALVALLLTGGYLISKQIRQEKECYNIGVQLQETVSYSNGKCSVILIK